MKRSGDDAAPRLYQTIGVMHAEAFQLMLYREVDGPGTAWFWNSRDGVTPFGTVVGGKEYRHAMRGYHTGYSAVLPAEAKFVWVDYTPEAWAEMSRRRWEHIRDAPASEWHDPAEFLKQWPTAEAFEEAQPYRPGEPMQLPREQFLETTHSWHARVSEEAEAA